MQESKLPTYSCFRSQSDSPDDFPDLPASPLPALPPTAALSMNEAESMNILLTSAEVLFLVACSRSVTCMAVWFFCISAIILSQTESSFIKVNAMFLDWNSFIKSGIFRPFGQPPG